MASANELTIEQASAVLNQIYKQATGIDEAAAISESDFVTVAQKALKVGYDPLVGAISQVLSRTIFSIRPYTAKFKGLMADSLRYGNHIRKLQVYDRPFEDDDRLKLEDGESVDMFEVKKPYVLQTNFYGEQTYQKHLTIFKDQLDTAFDSVEGFNRFVSMYLGNASDMIEQAKESMSRATIANLILGVLLSRDDDGSESVVHLITEYNKATGSSVTADDVQSDDNFPNFAKWLYGFVRTLSQRMEERSVLYHTLIAPDNVTDTTALLRHTPVSQQKIYLYRPFFNNVDTRVLSDVYHDEYLKMADREDVMYWQSIKDPMTINSSVVNYIDTAGSVVTGSKSADNVLGVIFDEEAAGLTVVNEWAQATPFNARGGYYNQYFHFTTRWWNDFSENAVVLVLD